MKLCLLLISLIDLTSMKSRRQSGTQFRKKHDKESFTIVMFSLSGPVLKKWKLGDSANKM